MTSKQFHFIFSRFHFGVHLCIHTSLFRFTPRVQESSVNNAVEDGVLLQNYLRKAPKVTNGIDNGPVTVYRKASEQTAGVDQLRKGQDITFDHFISTSKTRDVSLEALPDYKTRNVQYTIETSSGVDITRLSQYPEQQEILIPLKTKFKVTNLEKVPDSTFDSGYRVEIGLKEIVQAPVA